MRQALASGAVVVVACVGCLAVASGVRASRSLHGAIEAYEAASGAGARFAQGQVQVPANAHEVGCCATNYSAAWDASGELIAFVVDNLLCPASMKGVRDNALRVAVWETKDEYMRRHSQSHREHAGRQKPRAASSSTFPGVMGFPVLESTSTRIEACIRPFLQRALESTSQYSQKRRVVALDEETSMYDAFMDLDASFFGSISLPNELLQSHHRGPHIDKDEESLGLAMVYTLTQNKSYEVTGTAFTQIPGLPSLSQGIGGSFHRERRIGQLERQRSRMGLDVSAFHLNSTVPGSNPFQDLLYLVRNRYNRAVFYPTNRLHTAMIPRSNLLVPDPHRGRLTLNSFWDVSVSPSVEQCDYSHL